jgi:anti-sigma B factor antagonist
MNMTISTRQVGGITILDIGGRIVLRKESASVRDVIRDLLNNGHKQILLNLGDVNCIDTIGLGSLVGVFMTVRKQGGDLKLLNLPEKFAGAMQITKLNTVFDIINDEAALRANISETGLVLLINEQKGEKEEIRDGREFSWCCSFPWGFGCRGTERRLASWRVAAECSGSQSGRRSGAGFAAGPRSSCQTEAADLHS